MKSWKTTNGIEIKQLLNGSYLCYLVEFGKLKILVDTTRNRQYPRLKKILTEILDGSKPDYLFLTHTHFDHVENAAKIKSEFGCKIIADEREAKFLASGSSPLPDGTNTISKTVAWIGRKFTKINTYDSVDCDVCVDDIYEIKTREDPVRILRTPGHSIGSISMILDNEIAIVGDAMYSITKNSAFPPFADNISDLLKSWEILLKTECSIFLPGHGRAVNRQTLEKSLIKERKKNRV